MESYKQLVERWKWGSNMFFILAAAILTGAGVSSARADTLYLIIGNSLCGMPGTIKPHGRVPNNIKGFAFEQDVPTDFNDVVDAKIGDPLQQKIGVAVAEYLGATDPSVSYVLTDCTPGASYADPTAYSGIPPTHWARGGENWERLLNPDRGQLTRILIQNPGIEKLVVGYMSAMPDAVYAMQTSPQTLNTLEASITDLMDSVEEASAASGRKIRMKFAIEYLQTAYHPVIQPYVNIINNVARMLSAHEGLLLLQAGPEPLIDPIHYTNAGVYDVGRKWGALFFRMNAMLRM